MWAFAQTREPSQDSHFNRLVVRIGTPSFRSLIANGGIPANLNRHKEVAS
jgi:hypothetical protein